MKSLAWRVVVLVATSAVAPLLIYGLVSVNSLRQGMRETVVAGRKGPDTVQMVGQQDARKHIEWPALPDHGHSAAQTTPRDIV